MQPHPVFFRFGRKLCTIISLLNNRILHRGVYHRNFLCYNKQHSEHQRKQIQQYYNTNDLGQDIFCNNHIQHNHNYDYNHYHYHYHHIQHSIHPPVHHRSQPGNRKRQRICCR